MMFTKWSNKLQSLPRSPEPWDKILKLDRLEHCTAEVQFTHYYSHSTPERYGLGRAPLSAFGLWIKHTGGAQVPILICDM